jgi:hypothetical protein
MIRSRRFFKR